MEAIAEFIDGANYARYKALTRSATPKREHVQLFDAEAAMLLHIHGDVSCLRERCVSAG